MLSRGMFHFSATHLPSNVCLRLNADPRLSVDCWGQRWGYSQHSTIAGTAPTVSRSRLFDCRRAHRSHSARSGHWQLTPIRPAGHLSNFASTQLGFGSPRGNTLDAPLGETRLGVAGSGLGHVRQTLPLSPGLRAVGFYLGFQATLLVNPCASSVMRCSKRVLRTAERSLDLAGMNQLGLLAALPVDMKYRRGIWALACCAPSDVDFVAFVIALARHCSRS